MENMKVSKDWIYQNLRPVMPSTKLEEANEDSCAIKTNNTIYYRKDAIYNLFVIHCKVYTRNYWDNDERRRGPEYEIPIPEELMQEILDGKFSFLNLKDIMQIIHKTSRESASRWIFQKRLYTIRFFGKVYYENP